MTDLCTSAFLRMLLSSRSLIFITLLPLLEGTQRLSPLWRHWPLVPGMPSGHSRLSRVLSPWPLIEKCNKFNVYICTRSSNRTSRRVLRSTHFPDFFLPSASENKSQKVPDSSTSSEWSIKRTLQQTRRHRHPWQKLRWQGMEDRSTRSNQRSISQELSRHHFCRTGSQTGLGLVWIDCCYWRWRTRNYVLSALLELVSVYARESFVGKVLLPTGKFELLGMRMEWNILGIRKKKRRKKRELISLICIV